MTVAVTIPPASSVAELERSLALAVGAGADAAVLAEAPLGEWAAAAGAAAFARGRTALPLGVAFDARDRHPLALWEQVAVLQRVAGPGTWPLLAGWDERAVRAHDALAPSALPFAAAPWLLAGNPREVAQASALGMRCVGPPGAGAAGAWGSAEQLAGVAADAELLLLATMPERFEQELRGVRALKQARVPAHSWIDLAVERFPSAD